MISPLGAFGAGLIDDDEWETGTVARLGCATVEQAREFLPPLSLGCVGRESDCVPDVTARLATVVLGEGGEISDVVADCLVIPRLELVPAHAQLAKDGVGFRGIGCFRL